MIRLRPSSIAALVVSSLLALLLALHLLYPSLLSSPSVPGLLPSSWREPQAHDSLTDARDHTLDASGETSGDGALRILCFGDSLTAGFMREKKPAPYSTALEVRVSKGLEEEGGGREVVTVVNGVPGARATEYGGRLTEGESGRGWGVVVGGGGGRGEGGRGEGRGDGGEVMCEGRSWGERRVG